MRRVKRLLAVIGLVAFGWLLSATGVIDGPQRPEDYALVRQAWDALLTQYVEASDLDSRQLAYDAIAAMANGVGDTGHTTFLTPAEAKAVHDYQARAGSASAIGGVAWTLLPGTRIALIRIPDFYDGSAADLRGSLTAALKDGATGWIVDVRENPGGRIVEAISMVSAFVSSGDVLRLRDADGNERAVPVNGDAVVTGGPVAVLVDRNSASASEIFATAIQEARRGTIIGTRTAGTGTVLNEYPLVDGSELWIGDLRWLTASGRSTWHVGLSPDILVSQRARHDLSVNSARHMPSAHLRASADRQLLAALRIVLRHSSRSS